MASMLLILALLQFFPVGVTGLECQTSAEAEIVFLVDGSWSIGRLNFRAIRRFMGRIVEAFDIGPDKVQIGVAQYSGDPQTEWQLNGHNTKQSLLDAIANLPYKGGNTLTGTALTFILSNHFREEAGLRPGAHKIGLLITDGRSQDDISSPAARLKEAGVELYVVGIKNVDLNELNEIASDPDEIHVYKVKDFSLLDDIVDDLTNNLCNSIKTAGGFSQPLLTQPTSVSVSLGQTAKLSCTSSSAGSWGSFSWYQQKPGQIPRLLIHSTTDRAAGLPDHFTGASSESIGYLIITNIRAEDEAQYYCAASESTYGNKYHSDTI